MKQYSPTSLGVFGKNCPFALEQYLAKRQSALLNETEYEIEGPEMAEIGIVFHACVHAAANERKKGGTPWEAIEATAIALASKIPVERVQAGRKMADEFVMFWEFPPLNFEHGVAFDKQWNEVEWDSDDRRVRLIFDAAGEDRLEDPVYGEMVVARGQDYKTGWAVDEDELNSVQFDLYTVALRKMYPDADAILIECISTRYHKTYKKLFVIGEEDHDLELAQRKRNVEFWFNAADASDGRPRVGPGCMRCNFTGICKAFQDRAKAAMGVAGEIARGAEEAAVDYAVISTRKKELETFLKEATAVRPVELETHRLGYYQKKTREMKRWTTPLEIWLEANRIELDEETMSSMRALFAVLKPGVTSTTNVIKQVAKTMGYRTQKEALETESEKHFESLTEPQWGWKPTERKGAK